MSMAEGNGSEPRIPLSAMGATRATGAGSARTSGGGRTRAINALQREPFKGGRGGDPTLRLLCPRPGTARTRASARRTTMRSRRILIGWMRMDQAGASLSQHGPHDWNSTAHVASASASPPGCVQLAGPRRLARVSLGSEPE